MAKWLPTDSGVTEFVYHLFHSETGETIDLDDKLLRELVELFVGAQLGFWRQINRLAQTRFPNRSVDRDEIQIVRAFVQSKPDQFVRLFAEHIPHYLMLRCRPSDCEQCTQKRPHYRPNDHYADHLAIWRTSQGAYELMMSETKASERYPRDLVRKSPPDGQQKGTMFDEFDQIECGEGRLALKNQLLYDIDWSLLVSSEEELQRLVEIGFWQRNLTYHGCVVTSEAKSRSTIFHGYREVAARDPDCPQRRWATVVPISSWEKWVDGVETIALDFLAECEAEGHF